MRYYLIAIIIFAFISGTCLNIVLLNSTEAKKTTKIRDFNYFIKNNESLAKGENGGLKKVLKNSTGAKTPTKIRDFDSFIKMNDSLEEGKNGGLKKLMEEKSPSSTKRNEGWRWATEEKPPSSPYAYAFVIGGIHEDRPAYKGFLYNVLIAVSILRRKGSNADFVLWVQLSHDSKLSGKLPDEDERLLRAMNVRVRVLDTVKKDSFAQIVYEKFRLLSMTEYKRVLFLDGDIMPRSNMDYVFILSENDDSDPLLRPNLIVATKGEPCNTAMFMVTPSEENWTTFQNIVARQREEGMTLPYPHFDKKNGWGHNFLKDGDAWEGTARKGLRWNFHASHSFRPGSHVLLR
jgi:hypothetical protein